MKQTYAPNNTITSSSNSVDTFKMKQIFAPEGYLILCDVMCRWRKSNNHTQRLNDSKAWINEESKDCNYMSTIMRKEFLDKVCVRSCKK